ncbi:valine--pyruvate transaminase [Oceanispirochaeta sp.]|jgi:valine--pyruvate aminotransferase|uniref:valine--pyruvate transaminase n=1 Tax=Oceanispirochaeta sp. TaxID=2035350 RepID=UPI0026180CD1|nr:valine--pyruvate transaminase [Oceanispirochaeta sp.]MDA3956391.1 valine--pyruvate transaminase [Oceanispirochaeta sp.]
MKLTSFGEKFTKKSGILELMDDLGNAVSGKDRVCMLGGGNPADIKEVQAVWRRCMTELMNDSRGLEDALANYDSPQGKQSFLESLAGLMSRTFGWEIGPENIAITNGSQSAFFILLNLFGGTDADGVKKKVLFPLCPEYIGYADQGVEEGIFKTCPASIEILDDFLFKYHVDFSRLDVSDDVGAICISRPTNPTGNVISDDEVRQLSSLAEKAGIPLIIDNAYGSPFPEIIFEEVSPFWNENTILSMSLSKMGLPSVRTGIIIARTEIIQAVSACNAIISLANGTIGQVLTEPLFRSGEILDISKNLVRPFYHKKSIQAQNWIKKYMPPEVDYRIHKSEGAIFLWIWFRNLNVTSRELYESLKERKVIVVPGEYFFFGLKEDWDHSRQCIRLNYSQGDDLVEEGIRILAEEAARVVQT